MKSAFMLTVEPDRRSDKCLVIAKPEISKKIEDVLAPEFLCCVYESPGDIRDFGLREHDIQCVVIHITNRNFPLLKSSIENLKQMCSFPIISLIQDIDMEVARVCGKIGIDRFISMHSLRDLKKSVSDAICQRPGAVSMEDLGIDIQQYPFVVRKALRYIQDNYISLLNVSEVAKLTGVCEGTLSRLFRKYDLAGPKKLLMQCKLLHAMKLMSRRGLSIKKIAEHSGFTSEKRFCEAFSNAFHLSPNQYLKQNAREGDE
jgi:AraC-like DNA-binding protein